MERKLPEKPELKQKLAGAEAGLPENVSENHTGFGIGEFF